MHHESLCNFTLGHIHIFASLFTHRKDNRFQEKLFMHDMSLNGQAGYAAYGWVKLYKKISY